MTDIFSPALLQMILAAGVLGAAAGVLSVFVVLRRWAYLGEGISHAGFGGVGTALLLSLAVPALASQGAVFFIASAFTLATAAAVAWTSRRSAVSGDAAIGIFVSVTLAWGIIASSIHQQHGHGATSGWAIYLFGDLQQLSGPTVLLEIGVSVAVLMVVIALWRQIVLYCFDPMLAEVSGVPVGFVHYLLVLLVALVIMAGWPLEGYLLVPALLVLPGATGLALSRNLKIVFLASVVASLIASVVGPVVSHEWDFIPPGPAIVMVLFVEFLAAHISGRFRFKS
jgi:ABC-type Mn2+/Zn2+ transport system permease subunit